MSRYAELSAALQDKSLRLTEQHLLDADAYVEAKLHGIGVAPAEVTPFLPIRLLSQIASAWAKRLAAIEQAVDTHDSASPMVNRGREYERIAQSLSDTLSRESLGLTRQANTGIGFFSIGRG